MSLEKLIQRYSRRVRALNVAVRKVPSMEVPYYSGMIDELENVIDDLKELLTK